MASAFANKVSSHKLTPVLEEHARLRRPPKYVKKLQDEFMETVNATTATSLEMCSTVGQFVESNWLPFIEEHRSSSTVTVYKFYWKHLLRPYLANQLVRDYTTAQAERMLHEIGRLHPTMKKATLHKLRSILSGIFKRAIGQGLRSGHNPIREVTPPSGPAFGRDVRLQPAGGPADVGSDHPRDHAGHHCPCWLLRIVEKRDPGLVLGKLRRDQRRDRSCLVCRRRQTWKHEDESARRECATDFLRA